MDLTRLKLSYLNQIYDTRRDVGSVGERRGCERVNIYGGVDVFAALQVICSAR